MRLNPAGTTPRNGVLKPSWARYSVALASGLAVLAAAGCASSGAAGNAVSSTITIAVSSTMPSIEIAPVYLAKQDGLFAAAGLKHVVIKPESQESAVFGALQSKKAQIAATDYGDLFYEQALAPRRGPSYEVLADGYDATAGSLEVLTIAGSGVTSPTQLPGAKVAMPNDDVLSVKGKTIPLNSGIPNSLETAAAASTLQDFTPDNDSVDWVEMPERDEFSALMSHKVQAILVGQPYIVQAELKGAFEVMDACSGATADLPLAGYASTSAWAKANPTAVADFQAAMAKAQTEASIAGPFQTMLHERAGMTVQEADLGTIGSYPTSTSEGQLGRVSRLLWQSGMVDTPFPPSIPLANER